MMTIVTVYVEQPIYIYMIMKLSNWTKLFLVCLICLGMITVVLLVIKYVFN